MRVDSHEALRKALAARSRPTHPLLEPDMEVCSHKQITARGPS